MKDDLILFQSSLNVLWRKFPTPLVETDEGAFRRFLGQIADLDWLKFQLEKTFASTRDQWEWKLFIPQDTEKVIRGETGDIHFVRKGTQTLPDEIVFRLYRETEEVYLAGTWFSLRGFNLNYNQIPFSQDTYENVRRRTLGYIQRFASLVEGVENKDSDLRVRMKVHGQEGVPILGDQTYEVQDIITLTYHAEGSVDIEPRPIWETTDSVLTKLKIKFDLNELEFLDAVVKDTDPRAFIDTIVNTSPAFREF
ncbi:MAG: hypothetical protein WC824_12565 [Bacteroidota bacterium]